MESEPGGINVVFVSAVFVGVFALLAAAAAFAMAWWDNNPKDTIRRGQKNPEFDNESAG